MNEKVLIKLMKAAYKGGGVKLWRSTNDVLYLCGAGWACAMLWKYVPGPVLGLIATWCHGLPRLCQGWWCLDAGDRDPRTAEHAATQRRDRRRAVDDGPCLHGVPGRAGQRPFDFVV